MNRIELREKGDKLIQFKSSKNWTGNGESEEPKGKNKSDWNSRIPS